MKTISVIIPAYNEELRIGKTLALLEKYIKTNTDDFEIIEIIIVDDGSTDRTNNIVKSFSNTFPVPIKIIEIKPNMGKGHAVKVGVLSSNGYFVLIYDADASTLPEEINKLFALTNEADFVLGSRTIRGSSIKISFHRKIIGILFHLFCSPLLPGIKDASCGMKLIEKNCARKIFGEQKINRFAFDIEILWLAKKNNFKIKEVGIIWEEMPNSKIKIFRDGAEMFISVLSIYKRNLFS
jgi:dolichyl-phosphate beta-glucosyltransferase